MRHVHVVLKGRKDDGLPIQDVVLRVLLKAHIFQNLLHADGHHFIDLGEYKETSDSVELQVVSVLRNLIPGVEPVEHVESHIGQRVV